MRGESEHKKKYGELSQRTVRTVDVPTKYVRRRVKILARNGLNIRTGRQRKVKLNVQSILV